MICVTLFNYTLCVYSVVLIEVAMKKAAVFCDQMLVFILITKMKVFGFAQRAFFINKVGDHRA